MSIITDPLSQAHADRPGVFPHWKLVWLLGPKPAFPSIRYEEQLHPWSVNKSQELHCPLLRIWDSKSGSQLRKDNRMLSRAPYQCLTTEEARKTSLATHLDHQIWTRTPYIFFTKSPSAIKELATRRSMKRNRGYQTLTVINPAARLRNGLPILDVAAETKHYGISDPYNKGSEYYVDHYVCLWEVTKEEIVGHYKWKDLVQNKNWYEEVVMPAFRACGGGEKPNSDLTPKSAFDMSTIRESLPSKSSAHTGTYAANLERREQLHQFRYKMVWCIF